MVKCPSCNSEYMMEAEHLEDQGECPSCGNVFLLKENLVQDTSKRKKAKKITRGDALDPIRIGNVIIKVIELTQHREYPCGDCGDKCSYKQETSLVVQKKKLCGTELLLDICNSSKETFNFDRDDVSLIDAEGFCLHPVSPCYRFGEWTPRFQHQGHCEIGKNSREKIVILFPESENEICAIRVTDENSDQTIAVKEFSEEVKKLLIADKSSDSEQKNDAPPQNDETEQSINSDYTGKGMFAQANAIRLIQSLERLIFARLNNTLTERETTQLDNRIANTCFEIEQLFNSPENLAFPGKEDAVQKYDTIKSDFKVKLKEREEKEKSEEDSGLEKRFNTVMALSPRDFEEWCAELFRELGFERPTTTPFSNDKGVDVFCKKNGALIAIQCKKYTGIVGAPEIQQFMGAIQNAGASGGYFITTGTFSIPAEQMARQNHVELIDRGALKEIIAKAMEKGIIPQISYVQDELFENLE